MPPALRCGNYGVTIKNRAKAIEAFDTAKENGTRVSLTICCTGIDSHHGRWWVASSEGPATVCFAIPLESSGAQ